MWWPGCTQDMNVHNSGELGYKEMGIKWGPGCWRLTIPETTKTMLGKTVWPIWRWRLEMTVLFLLVTPILSISSYPALVSRRIPWQMSTMLPPQLLASEIKQPFPSTKLACLLASEILHTFSNTHTYQIYRNRMVGAGVWREGGGGVTEKWHRVSFGKINILEMGDDDGCPSIWMYSIQLNS